MDKLLVGFKTQGVKAALDEILHCFDIVVGGLLYLFHLEGIVVSKVLINGTEVVLQFWTLGKEFLQRKLGYLPQGNEIFYLYTDAIANQCTLGKVRGKCIDLRAIAAVNGGNGVETVHTKSFLFSTAQGR